MLGCTGVTQQSRLSAGHPTAWPMTCLCLPRAADGAGRGHTHCFSVEGAGRVPREEGTWGEVSRLGFWGDLVSPGNKEESMKGFSQSNPAFYCFM